MTSGKKAKQARRARRAPEPGARRSLLLPGAAAAATLALAALAALLLVDRGDDRDATAVEAVDPGPVHVHGLGVDPADSALFIATHSGLYRVASDEQTPVRVGTRMQDTMGFTVVGRNRFLGSGHPDVEEARSGNLPPLLGLIESNDAGNTWRAVSLLGEADFHVLRFARGRLYGYDASNDRLLMSPDGGRSWTERARPGPIIDLAVDPTNPTLVAAAVAGDAEQGLYLSRDGGRAWRRVGEAAGLLAWPQPDALYLVDGAGAVWLSRDRGARFAPRGEIGGEPAAFLGRGNQLLVALHDGTIKRSTDGGTSWTVRAAP